MNEKNDKYQEGIAGFWRRLFAFVLDCLLLAIIGVAFGYFFTDVLVSLGALGRCFGFIVSLLYFGVLNSKLSGGQTIGKKLLKIRVVDKNNMPLSLPKAVLRFLPLGVPWFANNGQYPDAVLLSLWIYALAIVVFGVGISVVYMYVFNRKTRQSLHDLLVGSYVVEAKASGPIAVPYAWRGHIVVCSLLVITSIIVTYFTTDIARSESFAPVSRVYNAVNSEPWVARAEVFKGNTLTRQNDGNSSENSYLAITAYSMNSDINNAERASKLAELALAEDKTLMDVDLLQVALVYGYDIGIASSWKSFSYTFPPAVWLAE